MKCNPQHILTVLCTSLFIIACSSQKQSVRYDYSYLYQEDQKLIKPQFKIFHHSQDSSTIYFQINSDDVLYGKLNNDSISQSRVLCKYKIYAPNGIREILDSATIPLVGIGTNNEGKTLQAHIKLSLPSGELYPVEIRFRDVYRDLNVAHYLWADKRLNNNEQFYLLQQEEQVLISPFLSTNTNYTLIKSPIITKHKFELSYSQGEFDMAPPPFAKDFSSDLNPIADSTIDFYFKNGRKSFTINSNLQWLKIPSDTNARPFYMYRVEPQYPDVSTFKQMIGPIRYISTSSEYKKLNQALNPKKELDQFWLSLGKNTDRAKKLIREFYRRVELANTYFTDYREGWKSDRGILFIVYGEPSTIYKDLNKEVWIYGEENSILSIKFEFHFIDHPMSNNLYRLIRNADYKNNWYRAVDNWRQAKVY
tara:strand:- start:4334 stop:5599 length:1266 start_codon:yes stop_codon:yes gene_type:complete